MSFITNASRSISLVLEGDKLPEFHNEYISCDQLVISKQFDCTKYLQSTKNLKTTLHACKNGAQGRDIRLLVIYAHGNENLVGFDENKTDGIYDTPVEEDFSDLHPDAKIILISCATALGIAAKIALVSKRCVYAPTASCGFGYFVYDQSGNIHYLHFPLTGDFSKCITKIFKSNGTNVEELPLPSFSPALLAPHQEIANSGNAIAKCHLGKAYLASQIVSQDFTKGIELLKESVLSGFMAGAAPFLSDCHKFGYGVPQSENKAKFWRELPKLQSSDDQLQFCIQESLQENSDAYELLIRGARTSAAISYALAFVHAEKSRKTKDENHETLATSYVSHAVRLENPEKNTHNLMVEEKLSQEEIEELFKDPTSGDVDRLKKDGSPESCYCLARMYLEGRGVSASEDEAALWSFQTVASSWDSANVLPVHEQGLSLLTSLAEKGNGAAINNLELLKRSVTSPKRSINA